jgi:xylulokinase
MSSPPYLLGIDLGTTTCRCVAFDLAGREVADARCETPVSYPRPLWAESEPEQWWRCVVAMIRQVGARVRPEQIAAVGLSGLMHAPVLLDESDRPLAPAMLWMDQRCAPQAAAMNAEGAGGERPIATTVSAPKLRWLAETHPELLARARSVVLPKDYLRIRLTGVGGTDHSDAGGTGLFDRERETWVDGAVAASRLPRALLPAVRPAWALAGGVSAAAAAETGLRAGTPVAVGGSDVLCTRVAVGPLEEGEVCLYMGTAAWMAFAGPRGADGQVVTRGFGSTATTGAALRWTRDLFGQPGAGAALSYEEVLAGADAVAEGAEGLIFLPHLMGERGPEPEPLARAAFVGLTLRHGRSHIARAVLEGTAFQIRRNFERRAPAPVRGGVVAGGAARSQLWMQILVDVVDVGLRVPAQTEASVLGAALLGGVAAGLFTLEAGQAAMVHPGRLYQPDPSRARRYASLYERYCRLDGLLMPLLRELSEEAAS